VGGTRYPKKVKEAKKSYFAMTHSNTNTNINKHITYYLLHITYYIILHTRLQQRNKKEIN
jgi:hypothetical protein